MTKEEIIRKYEPYPNKAEVNIIGIMMEEYAKQEVSSNAQGLLNIVINECQINELNGQSITVGEIKDIIRLHAKSQSILFATWFNLNVYSTFDGDDREILNVYGIAPPEDGWNYESLYNLFIEQTQNK